MSEIGTTSGTIQVETCGAIVTIRLNRPEVNNAINSEMENEILRVLELCQADPEVKCVLLAANGTNFSAGHDIAQVARERVTGEAPATLEGHYWARTGEMLPTWRFSKALVVAAKGFVGPHAIAWLLTADVLIAAENTRFSFEETRIGIGAPYGPYALLAYHFPIRVVKQLWIAGGWMDAATALRLDFVNRVVPLGEEEEEARRYCRSFEAMDVANIVANKQGIHQLYEAAGLEKMIDAGREPYQPSGAAAAEQAEHFAIIHERGVAAAIRNRDSAVDRAVLKV